MIKPSYLWFFTTFKLDIVYGRTKPSITIRARATNTSCPHGVSRLVVCLWIQLASSFCKLLLSFLGLSYPTVAAAAAAALASLAYYWNPRMPLAAFARKPFGTVIGLCNIHTTKYHDMFMNHDNAFKICIHLAGNRFFLTVLVSSVSTKEITF